MKNKICLIAFPLLASLMVGCAEDSGSNMTPSGMTQSASDDSAPAADVSVALPPIEFNVQPTVVEHRTFVVPDREVHQAMVVHRSPERISPPPPPPQPRPAPVFRSRAY